jgi:hypothetical protein
MRASSSMRWRQAAIRSSVPGSTCGGGAAARAPTLAGGGRKKTLTGASRRRAAANQKASLIAARPTAGQGRQQSRLADQVSFGASDRETFDQARQESRVALEGFTQRLDLGRRQGLVGQAQAEPRRPPVALRIDQGGGQVRDREGRGQYGTGGAGSVPGSAAKAPIPSARPGSGRVKAHAAASQSAS